MKIRVRYAPSPTGYQHIGSIRTALFNYLFSKANKGDFILRLEDTDKSRCSEVFAQDIYETFSWLGLKWNEGPDVGGNFFPYIQSKRLSLYTSLAQDLVKEKKAYYCFCEQTRLDAIRAEQKEIEESDFGYDRRCRNLAPEVVKENLSKGIPSVIRIKIPDHGKTKFQDGILGQIEWQNKDINPDPIIIKSDTFPTYHLANVIDDHYMQITHVLRAQEWIPSTPIHLILYNAFSWDPPVFMHLPMVLGQDGQKLSKRHGATSIKELRSIGYLPTALLNYIAHLGCSFQEGQEVFSLSELENLFVSNNLHKSAAVFDYKKLDWHNRQIIQKETDVNIAHLILPYMQQATLVSSEAKKEEIEFLQKISHLVKGRINVLKEAPLVIQYFYKDPEISVYKNLLPDGENAKQTIHVLDSCLSILTQATLKTESLENAFRNEANRLNIKFGDYMYPLRLGITGTKNSPPLLESISILGYEKVIRRLQLTKNYLISTSSTEATK